MHIMRICTTHATDESHFLTQNLFMKIPQDTLSEIHSKQPFHRLGKLRVKWVHQR